jgi:tRNA nucleotidyltransferase (CCA-adding enzyme)
MKIKDEQIIDLNDILDNIENEKKDDVYMGMKKRDFSTKETKIIFKSFLENLINKTQPSVFLNEYLKLSILKKVFPDLYKLTLTVHDPIFHPEKDMSGLNTVWGHTMIALDISKKLTKIFNLDKYQTFILLFATLLHDIGKPDVTDWEYKRGRIVVSSPFHDSKGVKKGSAFLKNIGVVDTEKHSTKTLILSLIKYHHRIYELYRNKKFIKLSAISRLKRDMLGYEELLILLDFADRQSRVTNPLNFTKLDEVSNWIIKKRNVYLELESKPKPFILGRDLLDLGMTPGKEIGIIVKDFYTRQLNGDFANRNEALKFLSDYTQ